MKLGEGLEFIYSEDRCYVSKFITGSIEFYVRDKRYVSNCLNTNIQKMLHEEGFRLAIVVAIPSTAYLQTKENLLEDVASLNGDRVLPSKLAIILDYSGEAMTAQDGFYNTVESILDKYDAHIFYCSQGINFAHRFSCLEKQKGRKFGNFHSVFTHKWLDFLSRWASIECQNCGPPTGARNFVCTMHKPRTHRAALLAYFSAEKLLENNFISFGGAINKDGQVKLEALEIDHIVNRFDLPESYKTELHNIIDSNTRISVDKQEISRAYDMVFDIPGEAYSNSDFSIVAESDFTNGSIERVTEKTLKAIIMERPFIILGNPGSLDLLNELGFRTDFVLFGIEYDKLANEAKRFKRICEIVTSIYALPESDYSVMLAKDYEIAKYNRVVLNDSFPSILDSISSSSWRLAISGDSSKK